MNKEEFKARANQRIDEISAKINELKAEKESVKGDLKKNTRNPSKNWKPLNQTCRTNMTG